ncbi:hypothetical protein [Amycolatopsis sp. H20-H5]|uniref:hypothetical protein n=1 Tax=Amycolatopsis sp. H20-H5 TaxID=3046309 RepID=UPI002DC01B7A|nr:hypothetical protein [Amycolatopsis sp. H20-H5]MEC3977919.1 hypothetical protein [Amycolatopsis sp. H20-H5]
MTGVQLRTQATPLPSAAKGRATPEEMTTWTPYELEIRACFHCHVVYRSAGYAWACEHWHERL